MPTLIMLALGWKWPGWAARLFGWAVPLAVTAVLTGAAIALLYHRGETAGAARVQAKAEAAHAGAVAEARGDERKAAVVAHAIGRRVAIADDQTTTLVQSKITEIRHDLASTAAAPVAADAPPVVFDTDGVRASLNVLVDRADRAADAADAER
jgi:hypothetical protein